MWLLSCGRSHSADEEMTTEKLRRVSGRVTIAAAAVAAALKVTRRGDRVDAFGWCRRRRRRRTAKKENTVLLTALFAASSSADSGNLRPEKSRSRARRGGRDG